jgi:predicted acetyltransferase
MTIEFRSPRDNEWQDFGTAISRGFGNHPPSDEASVERWKHFADLLTSFGAWDGHTNVGTSGYLTADTSLPGGGKLPTALVTIVTVAATHRRSGILTNMMKRMLEHAHKQGLPIATLWASESVIYGRFGYGMAGQHHYAKITSGKTEIVRSPEIKGSMRFVNRALIRELGPDIWTRTMEKHPGMPQRTAGMWQWNHPLPEDRTATDKLMFYALYEENGKPEGYVAYKTVNPHRPDDRKNIVVEEMIATTDAANAALWHFLLGIDLVNEVVVSTMPLDDPLWWMLADPRQLNRRPHDAIWLRILDVERALTARTYSADCDLVFEVQDEFCPWTDGKYRLTVADGKANCARTTDAPDILLPTASLATCYFGSVKFGELARAARAEERTTGAFAAADRTFAAEREPWCPLHY